MDDRVIALAILCTGFFMTILDSTIVNVALPSIQRDLGFSAAGLAWVLNAYLIAFAGLLLLAGRLGDLLGRRRVFLAGLALFIVASAACGLAGGQGALVAARFAQGAGGALASAVILGMIVTLFPAPAEQARAIGAYAAVGAVGASAGLVLGGVLTQAISWHWIFFVNVPVGVATIALAVRHLPADAGLGWRSGADLAGAALATGTLMAGVDAIVEAAGHGWGSARTLGLGGAAVALAVGFLAREARAAAPLVPLRIFRVRSVAVANLTQVLLVAGAFGQQFLVALYLKGVRGDGPIAIGLATLPIAVVIGSVALFASGPAIARFGARRVLLGGLALTAASFALLTRLPADATYATDLLPSFVLMGTGFGLASPALTTQGMAGVEGSDAGLASGLLNTTQQIGAALGLSVLATVSASRAEGLVAGGVAQAEALTSGYRLAFAVATGFVVAAAAVAARGVRPASTPLPAAESPLIR